MILFCGIDFHAKDSIKSEGLRLVHRVPGDGKRNPCSFSWQHLSVEWEFPVYRRDISMEIMSAWLEVLIKMTLGKCYISINKQHNESLPSIPIMCVLFHPISIFVITFLLLIAH